MVKVFPGYKYNKDFFEAMLVPQKKKKTETKKETGSFGKIIGELPVIIKFIYKLIFYKKDARKFITSFDSSFARHKNLKLEEYTALEISEHYNKLEKHFLDKWKIPILNDFRLMVFHGLLSKIISQIMGKEKQNYLNILISNFKRDDELKVIKALYALAEKIKTQPKLKALFQEKNIQLIKESLFYREDKVVQNFKKDFDNYLKQYGARRPDELKLESIRLEEKPEFIINIIKNFSKIELKKHKAP
jgi:hypothetical protein